MQLEANKVNISQWLRCERQEYNQKGSGWDIDTNQEYLAQKCGHCSPKIGSSVSVCSACMWRCVYISISIHPSIHHLPIHLGAGSQKTSFRWNCKVLSTPSSRHSTVGTFQNTLPFHWASFAPTLGSPLSVKRATVGGLPPAPWPTCPSGCPTHPASPAWLFFF